MPAFFTRNQLEAKKRTELQSLAKEHNIKGNLKTEDLVAELHRAMEKQKKSATSTTATHTRKMPSASEAPARTRVVSGSSKIPAPAPSTSVSKSAAASTTTQSVVKSKAKGEPKVDDMPPPKRAGRGGRPPSAKPSASTLSRSAPPGASSSRRRKTPMSPTSGGENEIDVERDIEERPQRSRVAGIPRSSLGTGEVFVEIPSRRTSMNVCGIPTSPQTPEGSVAVRPTENEGPIPSTSQNDVQRSRHFTQSSITPATIFTFPPSPSTSSTLLGVLKGSKEFEGIVLDTEASKIAINTLTETLRLERQYTAQLREELDAVKQGKDTAVDDVKALREELSELKRIDETSKRESESITESLKVTLHALESYARGLESRLKKLEETEEVTEEETPAPLNLGKRDRVDTPEKSPEAAPSPSGQPSPSKRARTVEPLEDEVPTAQQPVTESVLEEPASVGIASTAESGPGPATHEETGIETGPTKTNGLNGESTLLSLGRPSSHSVVNDEPPQSSPITAYFSSLVPPPSYQHPPSPNVPKDSLVPAPSSAGLIQAPISALPFPLTASKPLTPGGLSGSASSTSRVAPRRNASSSRHNPIGRKSTRGTSAGGRAYKPVSPANVGNTGAVSFGYSVGSPAAMSTPRSAGSPPDEDGYDESVTLTPPKMPAPTFDPLPVPRSNTFRAPSFEFGPQLSNASSTSPARPPKPTSALNVEPSPAFSVDNAPRGYDEGVDFTFTDEGLMGLDSPPPPSPSKRTMYGTEIHQSTSQSTSLLGGTASSSGPFSLFGSIRHGASSNVLGSGPFGGSSTSPGSSNGGVPRAPEPRFAELPPVDEDSGLEKEGDGVFQQTEGASLIDDERLRGPRSNYGLDDPMTWGSPKRSTS